MIEDNLKELSNESKNGVWYDENEHDLYIIGQNYTKISFRPYKEW